MERIAIALIVVLYATPLHAAIVFQNNTTYTGVTNPLLPQGTANSTEHGNTITLASTERIVTSQLIYLRILGAGPATFNYELRYYRLDGPGGIPDSLIWASGPRSAIIDSGAVLAYSCPVPSVVVPDSFVWTVQITNRMMNMDVMGPAEYNPPTVGSAPFGYWRRTGGGPTDWQYTGLAEAPFGARVDASPCPVPRDGDLNGNGTTDGADLQAFVNGILAGSTQTSDLCRADFNGNAILDPGDVPEMVSRLLG